MLLWSGSCAAEPPADDVLRAAYCFGVVGTVILKEPEESKAQLVAGCQQADPKVWTIKDCVSAMSRFTNRTRQTLWRSWHRRFAQFEAFLDGVPAENARSLLHAYDNGKWDALDKMSAKSMAAKSVTKCFENCLRTSAERASCIVECIAQHDQVHANVLRCQLMPDDLPF